MNMQTDSGLQDEILYLQEAAKPPLLQRRLTSAGQEAAWNELHKAQSRSSFCHFPQYITSDIKISKTYVLCEEDKAVDPSYQEAFVQVGQYDKVVRLPSGHSPFLSMPQRVVEIVMSAAQA